MLLDFVNSPLKTKCQAVEDTSVSYYLCHIVKALTKRKQNKGKCSCHKSKGGRPSMSYHKTKKKKKKKNRKKKQNLDAKGKIFNIVHLLTI